MLKNLCKISLFSLCDYLFHAKYGGSGSGVEKIRIKIHKEDFASGEGNDYIHDYNDGNWQLG